LLGALDLPLRTGLEKALAAAELKAKKSGAGPLTEVEKSLITNKFLESRRPSGSGAPGFTKQRKLESVSANLEPFYADPADALVMYAQRATQSIERARFFGKDAVKENGFLNLDKSIGAIVQAELNAKRIDAKGVVELTNLLETRFGGAQQAAPQLIQHAQQAWNVMLLAQVDSALVQLGDLVMSVAHNGLLPTAKALQTIVTKTPGRLTARDYGLVSHMAEEVIRRGKMTDFTDWAFKASGFRAVDLLGKSTYLNAALTKYTKLAANPRGVQTMRARYGDYFGRDFDPLVADLRAGRQTTLTDELLFRDLAGAQPISRIESTQFLMDNPKLRFIGTLKSWMIKQADVLRREVYQNFKKGEPVLATKQLIRFGIGMAAAGATSEWIRSFFLNRDDEVTWGDLPLNFFKTFALSEYFADKAEQKGYIRAYLEQTMIPPVELFEKLIAADPESVKLLPVFGRVLESWSTLGREQTGAEIFNERKEKREQRKANAADPVNQLDF
jgi:hypothetical protein